MIPLELEPADAVRRADLLADGINALKPAQPVWKKFVTKPERPEPATPREAARAAVKQFNRATRGSTMMIDRMRPPETEAAPVKSSFKGVYPNNSRIKPWCFRVSLGGKQSYGAYATEEEAARAFDAACVEHGRAAVNFPGETNASGTHAPAPAPRSPARPRRSPTTELVQVQPGDQLGRELAAAASIAAALGSLERSAAMRVLAFVGGHYQSQAG